MTKEHILSSRRRCRKFGKHLNENKEYKFKSLTFEEDSRQVKVNGESVSINDHGFD